MIVRDIALKLLRMASLLIAVLTLNFGLVHLAPGDAATAIAGASGGLTEEQLAEIRQDYRLDQPLPVQLGSYLRDVFTGDLGYSYYNDRPVTDLILERLGPTLLLAGTALLVGLLVGSLLGVVAARRPDGLLSSVISIVSVVGFSMPAFFTGIVLVLIFAVELSWFPTSGMRSIVSSGDGWGDVLDVAHHLFLPAACLAFIYLALYSRTARASMVEVLGADYVRTAWAKGLPERRVVMRHALRNAMLPVVTMAGLQMGALLSSAVLVEVVFDWPGLGRLAMDSIARRDTPTILGILAASSVLVVVTNVVVDLLYRVIDPRISVKGRR